MKKIEDYILNIGANYALGKCFNASKQLNTKAWEIQMKIPLEM